MQAELFLLGYKALKCLEALESTSFDPVSHVIIGQDKNIQDDCSEEIRKFCQINGISYSFREENKRSDADHLIAIGWRWLIKTKPGQKLIVFHDSLLPKYRGFNPLVTALVNGDTRIGVTAFFATEKIDDGDIIEQWQHEVRYPVKIFDAIKIVSEGYAEIFKNTIRSISENREIASHAQGPGVTYSVWRDEEDYFIEWSDPAEKIKRFIDAVGYPYSGAMTMMDGKTVIIDDAEVYPAVIIENPAPGKVIFKDSGKPVVICGSGLIKINTIRDLDGHIISFPGKIRIRFR